MLDCSDGKLPVTGRRRSLGPETTRREAFRQNKSGTGVQRFDADYLWKAKNHSAGRNDGVAALLCYLSFIRNLGDIPAGASVNWDKAHVQAIRGSHASNAAHALPCQILVAGQYPWLLVRSSVIDGERLRTALRELFGRVWILPKAFNLADCAAEDNCLRSALVAACDAVIRNTRKVPPGAGVLKRGVGPEYGTIQLSTTDVPAHAGAGVDARAVEDAFADWKKLATAAFDRADNDVRDNGLVYAGTDYTDDVVYILGRYRAELQVRPSKLIAHNVAALQNDLWLART